MSDNHNNNNNNKSTKKPKIPKPLKFLRNRSKIHNKKQRETREEQRIVDHLPSDSQREQTTRDSTSTASQRAVNTPRSSIDASSTITQRPVKTKKKNPKIYNPHLSGEILQDQDEYVHVPRHSDDDVHSNEDDKPPSFVHIENPKTTRQKSSYFSRMDCRSVDIHWGNKT